jgi:hypothetical protein
VEPVPRFVATQHRHGHPRPGASRGHPIRGGANAPGSSRRQEKLRLTRPRGIWVTGQRQGMADVALPEGLIPEQPVIEVLQYLRSGWSSSGVAFGLVAGREWRSAIATTAVAWCSLASAKASRKKRSRVSNFRFLYIHILRPGDHLNSSPGGKLLSEQRSSRPRSISFTLSLGIWSPPTAASGPIPGREGFFSVESSATKRSML